MLAAVSSATVLGIEALDVLVEVHVANGLPQWTLVGMAATAVKESRDRVQAALVTSGFTVPPRRLTVNLQPGDLPKHGTAFDLPIALAVLAASGQLPTEALGSVCAVGELGLDGQLHAVRGVLTIARRLTVCEAPLLVVPAGNLVEAQRVPGVRVLAAATLAEVVQALRRGTIPDAAPGSGRPGGAAVHPDIADVVGQPLAVRATEISAAGGHNLLLVGPPGAGKTMLARRMPGILPPLGEAEALEVMAIHSVAGLLDEATLLPEHLARPFRAPHHTVSAAGLIGGGGWPRPGEVSLAHHGVLFLDELSLFPRHTLESLRQPLEDGAVTVSRAARAIRFPSRFSLVAASNPCPCGYAGCDDRPCRCSLVELERHRSRLSGPLSDRIDLHVHVTRVPTEALDGYGTTPNAGTSAGSLTSAVLRRRVAAARHRQQARYAMLAAEACPRGGALTNATVPERMLVPAAQLEPPARALLLRAADRLRLSARGYHRVLRVARTIADLDGSDQVSAVHLGEALRFRPVGATEAYGDSTAPSGAGGAAGAEGLAS